MQRESAPHYRERAAQSNYEYYGDPRYGMQQREPQYRLADYRENRNQFNPQMLGDGLRSLFGMFLGPLMQGRGFMPGYGGGSMFGFGDDCPPFGFGGRYGSGYGYDRGYYPNGGGYYGGNQEYYRRQPGYYGDGDDDDYRRYSYDRSYTPYGGYEGNEYRVMPQQRGVFNQSDASAWLRNLQQRGQYARMYGQHPEYQGAYNGQGQQWRATPYARGMDDRYGWTQQNDQFTNEMNARQRQLAMDERNRELREYYARQQQEQRYSSQMGHQQALQMFGHLFGF